MNEQPKPGRGGKREGAGRPRVYSDSAQRKAAYRQRRKKRAEQHAYALLEVAERPSLDPEARQIIEEAALFITS